MASPLDTIHEYYGVFSTLDLAGIASYFSEPSMTMGSAGLFAAADRGALADSLAPLIESLKARKYGRSEFVDAQVTMLGDADAIVRGVAARYTAAGAPLERVALSYVMHRTEAGWKIAVLVAEQ